MVRHQKNKNKRMKKKIITELLCIDKIMTLDLELVLGVT